MQQLLSLSPLSRSSKAGTSSALRLVFCVALLLCGMLALPAHAGAQTCTVTDNTDSTSDTGSLRYCVNNAVSGETINFSSSLHGQTITLNAANGPLTISQDVTIQGPGAKLLTVSGGNVVGVFQVNGTVSISGLTIANGNAISGGGISNSGTLTVSNSTISGNSATLPPNGCGGTCGVGGGIENGRTLTVNNSTISGNHADEGGGGIYNYYLGTLTVSNSTISGNSSKYDYGGGIYADGTLTVSNSTISGNRATIPPNGCGGTCGEGGGIFNDSTFTLSNSIVAGNAAAVENADLWGGYTDSGGNEASSNSSPTSTIAISLAPLGNYGGTAQTMVPLPGSTAICAGLAANILTGVTTDQRGYPRTNTTYTGYSSASPCVDSGAVQSHYTSVRFVQQPTSPLVNSAISPAPTVQVLEINANLSTKNTDAVNGIPLTLAYSGGPSEIGGTLTETTTGSVATFGGLTPNTAGTGFTLSTSVTVVADTTLTAMSSSFNVNGVPAVLQSPTPGSTLALGSVTFIWNTGAGVTGYKLFLGTTGVGSYNMYDSGAVTATTVTVASIPANGATLYARLWSEIGGVWESNDYTYTEAPVPVLAVLQTPTPGTLGTANVTFTWSSGTDVTEYELRLGTTGVGSLNLYNSGDITATTVTVPSIPATGAKVYARLYSKIGGVWKYADYAYTEAAGIPSVLQTPTPGGALGTTDVTFTWSAGTNVTEYELRLGSTGAGSLNLFNSGDITATTVTVPSIPANGATVYARLYSKIDGVWKFNDYIYTEK